jgi:hypothetical protein
MTILVALGLLGAGHAGEILRVRRESEIAALRPGVAWYEPYAPLPDAKVTGTQAPGASFSVAVDGARWNVVVNGVAHESSDGGATWTAVAAPAATVAAAPSGVSEAGVASTGGAASLATPAWIIPVGAFPNAAAADAFIASSRAQGHEGLSRLWIPDWPSLSGRPMFVVYDGPFPYADRARVTQRVLAVRAWSAGAYAVKLDKVAGREEIRP